MNMMLENADGAGFDSRGAGQVPGASKSSNKFDSSAADRISVMRRCRLQKILWPEAQAAHVYEPSIQIAAEGRQCNAEA